MKTELTHTKQKPVSFPLLAQSIHRDTPALSFTVLFVSPQSGTVVHCEPDAVRHIGETDDHWCPVHNHEQWRILSPGEAVTLRNG